MKQPWTPEHEQLAREILAKHGTRKGRAIAEIAAVTGRTTGSVTGKIMWLQCDIGPAEPWPQPVRQPATDWRAARVWAGFLREVG